MIRTPIEHAHWVLSIEPERAGLLEKIWRCANCRRFADVRVKYGSTTIEPAEVNLCLKCSFQLHQEMLGHLMWLGGWIEEAPLEESVTHA